MLDQSAIANAGPLNTESTTMSTSPRQRRMLHVVSAMRPRRLGLVEVSRTCHRSPRNRSARTSPCVVTQPALRPSIGPTKPILGGALTYGP